MGDATQDKEKVIDMKKNQTLLNLVVVLIALSPIAYLLITWSSIPESITMSFNFNKLIVEEEKKQMLIVSTTILSVTSVALYFLLRNLKRIDPKVKRSSSETGFNRLGISLVIFLTLLNFSLILIAVNAWVITKKEMFIFVGLLFALLGNYMNNLKPNFFAGIRLHWTLNDENNWRKTHQLAGKLWFFGGILVALFSWFLPETVLIYLFVAAMIVLVLIPGIYSYRLFKQKS